MNIIAKRIQQNNVVTYNQMLDLIEELNFFYYTIEEFAEQTKHIINNFTCEDEQLLILNNELAKLTSNSLLLLSTDNIYDFDFLSQVEQQLTHGTKDAYHLKQKIEAVQTEDFYVIRDGDGVKEDENGNKLLARSKYIHIINELQDDIKRVYNKKCAYLTVLQTLQNKKLIDFYRDIKNIDVQPLHFTEYTFNNFDIDKKTKGHIAEEVKQTFNKSLVLISYKCKEMLPYLQRNKQQIKTLSELYNTQQYNEFIKQITNHVKQNSNTNTIYELLISELQSKLTPIYNNYIKNINKLIDKNDSDKQLLIQLKQQIETEISYDMSL